MAPTSDPKATVTRGRFRLTCSVTTDIDAPAETVWALLTDSSGFASWNSTVTAIDGTIAAGQKLRISVPYATRTFPATVSAFEAPQTMTWSDGFLPMFRGVRTFTLSREADDSTRFTMTEVFRGLLLPMIASSFPDFGPIFEQYARDLAAKAEGARS